MKITINTGRFIDIRTHRVEQGTPKERGAGILCLDVPEERANRWFKAQQEYKAWQQEVGDYVRSINDSPSLTTTDYHGKQTTFTPGMPVMHVTDDGNIFPGTLTAIVDELLFITWPDDETGWELPNTCYPG